APGMVFGTVGYMAPEQVRAELVDHRADIFAFGVVLYEMVTGARAFSRDTPPETMTAILRDDVAEPPLSARQVPLSLTRIIRRCTEKNPNARFQSALDLAFAIDAMETGSSGSVVSPEVAAPARSRERLAWAVAIIAAVVAAAAVTRVLTPRPQLQRADMIRLSATPPAGWSTNPRAMNRARPVVIAPDGRKVAIIAALPGEAPKLFLRYLAAVEMKELPGTENVTDIMWSSDSTWLSYSTTAGTFRIDPNGGTPALICECFPLSGFWKDGELYFGSVGQPIRKVALTGGTPTTVTHLEGSETTHAGAATLGDGRHFLYTSLDSSGRHVSIATFDGTSQRRIKDADYNSFSYPNGFLIYEQANALIARRLNVERAELEGEPVTIAEHVYTPEVSSVRWGIYDVSGDVIAYQTGPADSPHELAWFDRTGRRLETIPGSGVYSNVEISPDGRRAALSVLDAATKTRDIWTLNVDRPVLSRLTFDRTEERSMVWSSDGRQLYYNSGGNRSFDIFRKNASGIGAIDPIIKDGKSKDPNALSGDDRWLVYRVTGSTGSNDLWVAATDGSQPPRPFTESRFDENSARLSPDGHWLAYASDESSQQEVYLVSFPEPGARTRVTQKGGDFPRWRGDGKELFYLTPDGTIAAVAISQSQGEVAVGTPQPLFRPNVPAQPGHSYAPSPDGSRFLVIVDTTPPPAPITILLNWTQLLHKK
ncbi:MAG: protein kinase, partial [Vicinamibacterales bacterium]